MLARTGFRDICGQFKEVFVSIYHDSFVSPLENMTGFLIAPVKPLSVPLGNILHDVRQRKVADLHLKMHMVGHKAKRMNPTLIPLTLFLKDLIEAVPLLVVRKDVLPGVPAKDNMVGCFRCMYA
jgi:hypothetical protein